MCVNDTQGYETNLNTNATKLVFFNMFVFVFTVDIIHFLEIIIIFFSLTLILIFILKSLNIYVYTVLTIVNPLKDVLPKKCYLFYFIKSSF